MSGQGERPYTEVSQIEENLIPEDSYVVFDWDNTLKLIEYDSNEGKGKLASRVSREFLVSLKEKRHCQLYVISAIRPSKINMETLLMEMDRLGLADVFAQDKDTVEVNGSYVRKGHVMICGYDKAEMFRDVFMKQDSVPDPGEDVCDGARKTAPDPGEDVCDGVRKTAPDPGEDVCDGVRKTAPVVFFDDELVNVINFSALVPQSKCYHIMSNV